MVILTLVIPSRNRQDLLHSLLLACTKSTSEDLEFVIADNSDRPVDLACLNLDSRFKVVRSEVRLSMSENWSLGLKNASGVWRVFLGDDDGVIPNELDSLVEALRFSPEEAVVSRFAHFSWPEAEGALGRVSIWLETMPQITWTGLKGNSYRDFGNIHFPIPYARTVFTKTLQERIIQSQSGSLFTATSPDINLGAAIQLSAKRIHILSGLTPFIVGTSRVSNGAQGPNEETKKDFGSLNSIAWLPELGEESLATNFLSYAEPIAQARRAQGLELALPHQKVMIWASLLSTRYRKAITSSLLASFPSERSFIEIASLLAALLRNPIRVVRLLKWALLRMSLNREKYLYSSSEQLQDSDAAASRLQEFIDEHRRTHPYSK